MSYLVLARKWRPQVFDAVIGQEHVTQTLKNAIKQNRVAHAFIFTGVRGVGKTSVARILAKALNCQKGPSTDPCNQCPSCLEITNGSSVDVYEIDGASNRGINEVRELRENVKYMPSRDRHKIFIIDEVHMLTQEAFNALLKTLEEPPRHIIFIMATTQPHKVPTTILSRCQRFDFRRIPMQGILNHLKNIAHEESLRVGEGALRLIAREAEGSMRDALSLLDQVVSFSNDVATDQEVTEILGIIDRRVVWDAGDAIISGDVPKCLNIVDHIYNYGYDMKQFCQELMTHFRNLMVTKTVKEPHLLINLPHDELMELGKKAETVNLETLQYYFYTLLEGVKDIRQVDSSRLVLEMLLTKMASLKPVVPLDEILARLDRLKESFTISGEKRISHTSPQITGRVESHESSPQEKDIIPSDIWRDMLRFIRQKNLLLASILEHAHPSWLDRETIRLSFRGNSFNFEMINEGYKGKLVSLFSQFFKRDVKVSITGDYGEGIMVSKRTDRSSHPIISDILEIFGGEITSFDERKP